MIVRPPRRARAQRSPACRHLTRCARWAALAAALLGPAGCGDDDASSGGKSGSGDPAILSGALEYEMVGHNASGQGLDYGAVTRRPIRGARVQVIAVDGGAVLGETTAGDDGRYTVTIPDAARVKLWIFAETVEPSITVEDNTAEDAVYVLESAEVDAEGEASLDVLARTGWGGESYTGPRAAAPFAVLDAAYGAALRFRKEVAPPPAFPPLLINWSPENRPEGGSVKLGQIGTSHWDEAELYILGKDGVDSDEFDAHVLVHEWGHYFESRLSRADSPGGPHGYGDLLDPRVALSEGWGNALSAMILDPDTVYADAMGPRQSDGFSWDIEVNDVSPEGRPGWFAEGSVEGILFDLYDAEAEPFDAVALGLGPLHEVLTKDMPETPALTTLFPFAAALKARLPGSAAAIDALCEHHGAGADLGIDAVSDAWGAGESHSGGVAGALPVYRDSAIGASLTLSLTGGADYNTLAQNRFVRITGDGAPVTVSATSAADVDLHVHRRGDVIKFAASASGNEQLSFPTESGEVYVINVQGFGEAAGTYSVALQIAH